MRTLITRALSALHQHSWEPTPRPACFGLYRDGAAVAERDCRSCPVLSACQGASRPATTTDPDQQARWDRFFLQMAYLCAEMSKDPSSKVGAVAVRAKRVLATGFNGFPAGMADDARLHDREAKYPRIVHAEQNIIAWAARTGISLDRASLYVSPFHPCGDCAKLIAQAGISEVVVTAGEVPARWRENFTLANATLSESGVSVRTVAPLATDGAA